MKNLLDLLNYQKKKRLLIVYPHPDDETMASGGLIMKAKDLGWKVIILTMTQGGEGKIYVHPRGKSVKELRREELKNAVKILGADELLLENFPDAYLRDCVDKWEKTLSDHVKKIDPGIVVTYDHTGITGNPDHVVLSIEVKKIIKKLPATKRPILLWSALDDKRSEYFKSFLPKDLIDKMVKPHYKLEIGKYILRKIRSGMCFRSQQVMPMIHSLYYLTKMRYECYHLVDLNKNYPYKYIPFEL